MAQPNPKITFFTDKEDNQNIVTWCCKAKQKLVIRRQQYASYAFMDNY